MDTLKNALPWEDADAALVGTTSRETLDYLFSVTYEELKRLASVVRRGDAQATMSSTALVNEAWIKLARSPQFRALSLLHFKRIAARAMRQLLIESARRRTAGKRSAESNALPLNEAVVGIPGLDRDVLALDAALHTMATLHPRQAFIVESRYFGGLEVAETAALLGVSEATVQREWRAAKAWLSREIRSQTT